MKRIAIVDDTDGRITNIIVVADDVDPQKFGGRELSQPQNIGDIYIQPKTLEEKVADLKNSQITGQSELTDLQAMAVDAEYRLTLLELGVTDNAV